MFFFFWLISFTIPLLQALDLYLSQNAICNSSLLDNTSSYFSESCFSQGRPCCNSSSFSNVSDFCNVNKTFTRNLNAPSNLALFEANSSFLSLSFINVNLVHLFSIEYDFFFDYLFRTIPNSQVKFSNTTFQSVYLRTSIIYLATNSSVNITNSFFFDYNPFEYFEAVGSLFFSYFLKF